MFAPSTLASRTSRLLSVAISMLAVVGSVNAEPAGVVAENVAPGVWRVRFGQPERFTPVAFREHPARLKALGSLPPADRPPVEPASIKFWTNARGCALEIPFVPGEQFYGLGMNLKTFQLAGGKKTIRVSDDQGTNLGDSHAPAPFYVSTRGYGVYVDTARYASFYFGDLKRSRGKTDATFVGVDVPTARGVDVYLLGGPDMRAAVERYNLFAGGGCLPPLWGLGVWYRASGEFGQKDVLALLRQLRDRHIPCDVFGLEPSWHSHAYSCTFAWSEKFPDPDGLIRETKNLGYKLNLWEHAFTHPTSPLYKPLGPWSGNYDVFGGLVPDFATPEGRKIFADYHDATLVAKGISGFKLDECDHQPLSAAPWSFPEQSVFPSGLDGEQMHLLIGPLYQRTVFALYRNRNLRTLGLARASGAMAAPLPFGIYSDFYDHRDYVRAIATSGFGGILWCPEVREAGSVEELYRRIETAVFSAVAQINCWYLKNPPWKQIDRDRNNRGEFMPGWETAEATCRDLLELRMRLIPYLYAAFAAYRETGLPPTRALMMDYPDDEAVRAIDDQYLFGPSMMVAPLFAGEKKRSVYLPRGDWYDFWTHEKYAGGRRIEVQKPAEQIPVFVKGNTLLPLAKPVECVTPKTRFEVTVQVFGDAPHAFTLIDDDGLTFDFEKDAQSRVTLRWNGREGATTPSGDYRGPSRYKIVGWTQVGK